MGDAERPGLARPTPTSSFAGTAANGGAGARNPERINAPRAPHDRGRVRRHGFELPWTKLQVASWILFAYCVSVFYVVSKEVLPGALNYVIGALHGVLAAAVFGLTLWISLTDPEDKDTGADRVPRQEQSFCHICRHTVRKTSKHCRTCNKCVAGFDHHCMWIQQCIGSKNYLTFFRLLVITTVLLGLEALTALSALVLYTKNVLVANDEQSHTIFISVYFCISLAATCAVGHLLLFHVRLIFRNETTYDYLVAKARASRTKQLQQQRQHQEHHLPGAQGATILPVRRMRCFGICGAAHQVGGGSTTQQSPPQPPQSRPREGASAEDAVHDSISLATSSRAISEGQVRLV